MLGNIRKNISNPVIQILLGIVIFVFIFFFGWSMTNKATPQVVAEVNGDPITPQEYQEAYKNLIDLYARITGQQPDAESVKKLGLARRAFDQLVDQKLLLQEVEKRNIKVSDEDLARAIQGQAAFQDNQVFSKDKYLRLLGNAGLTPEHYEDLKRRELALNKLKDSLKSNITISESDILAEFNARHTSLAVDYMAFDPETYAKQLKPTDDKLREFYKAESETFRSPEKRSARYILFPVENYMSQVAVTEAQAKEEFRVRSFNFVQKASIHARHILVRVPENADDAATAKAEAKAKALRETIIKGLPFEVVAKTSSEDETTKAEGGDLGTFPRGTMIPAFENAAFALKEGEVSQPVRTQFGFHLIKVIKKTDERQRTFEEAKGELIDLLKREKARDLSYRAADNTLMDLEKKETDWTALSRKQKVVTTPLLTSKEAGPEVPRVKGFSETLFEMPDSKVGTLLETPAGTYLVSVAEKRPEAVPPFESIRTEVTAAYRVVEGRKLAKEAAAKFATEAAAKGWSAASALLVGAVSGTSETFTMKGGSIPPLGPSPEALKAIFEKPETGRVVPGSYEIEGKSYAFRISAMKKSDAGSLEAEREKIKSDLMPARQDEEFEAMLKKLRESAKIKGLDENMFK